MRVLNNIGTLHMLICLTQVKHQSSFRPKKVLKMFCKQLYFLSNILTAFWPPSKLAQDRTYDPNTSVLPKKQKKNSLFSFLTQDKKSSSVQASGKASQPSKLSGNGDVIQVR